MIHGRAWKQYIFWSYDICFQCYEDWWKYFHTPVRKKKAKMLWGFNRVSDFALLLVVFKWHDSEGGVKQRFSTFKQPKRRMKMAARWCHYQQRLTLRRKTNTCTDRRHPVYYSRPQIIQANWIHASRLIILNTDGEREGHENIEREGVTGSQTSAIILGTGKYCCCHVVSSHVRLFDVTCVALLVKQGKFPV